MTNFDFPLFPAPAYVPASDVALLTSYFNPGGYRTKYENYIRFRKPIETAGAFLMTVELAFGMEPLSLQGSENCPVLQVRAKDVMWQKERLLNIGLANLPTQFTKVVWLDCDLLFCDMLWLKNTSALLDEIPVVQPFEWIIRLARGAEHHDGKPEVSAATNVWWQHGLSRGFGAVFNEHPRAHLEGDFAKHGHSGYAWAARRSALSKSPQLYDACIAGSGDHMIAHAAVGDWESPCVMRCLGATAKQLSHFQRWAIQFSKYIVNGVGFTPGIVLHLWHGDLENRRYIERHKEMRQFDFDPYTDICLSDLGVWRWNSNKPQLHQWLIQYFQGRREDGTSL